MILLDTNAILWLLAGHRRGQSLDSASTRLFISPVSILELSLLEEVGKLQLRSGTRSVLDVVTDDRWQIDDPASAALFRAALPLTWTRDPFDRLLVAHASLRRWQFATGDQKIHEMLGPDRTLRL